MTGYTQVCVTIVQSERNNSRLYAGSPQRGMPMCRQVLIMVAVGMATISSSWCTTARAAGEAEAVAEHLIELVNIGRVVVLEHSRRGYRLGLTLPAATSFSEPLQPNRLKGLFFLTLRVRLKPDLTSARTRRSIRRSRRSRALRHASAGGNQERGDCRTTFARDPTPDRASSALRATCVAPHTSCRRALRT